MQMGTPSVTYNLNLKISGLFLTFYTLTPSFLGGTELAFEPHDIIYAIQGGMRRL